MRNSSLPWQAGEIIKVMLKESVDLSQNYIVKWTSESSNKFSALEKKLIEDFNLDIRRKEGGNNTLAWLEKSVAVAVDQLESSLNTDEFEKGKLKHGAKFETVNR